MLNNSSPKIANIFGCEICYYKCSKQSDYKKHLLTRKHKSLTSFNTDLTQKPSVIHKCATCNKIYKSRVGLWYHKNKCNMLCVTEMQPVEMQPVEMQPVEIQPVEIQPVTKTIDDFINLTNLVLEVVKSNNELQKQNNEMQKQLLNVCKNGIINNSNNNVNSNNKIFNLQVFLNEDCKDAMNITDFVNSINLQLSDLESVGKLGYVEGISNIIIKNLSAMDVTKRPVHCTDPKRETIYIKDGDVWEKDDDDNKKLRKMIRSVAFRNCKNTRLFKEKYPDCTKYDSKYSDIYNKIVVEVMGGGPKSNDIENQNKIIRKIAKVMTIDKIHL